MALSKEKQSKATGVTSNNGVPSQAWRMQLARELFEGRYKPGQRVQLREITAKYKVDDEAVLKAFAEFQVLGMVTLSRGFSAIIHSPNPKEMHEAYELRAAVKKSPAELRRWRYKATAPACKTNWRPCVPRLPRATSTPMRSTTWSSTEAS